MFNSFGSLIAIVTIFGGLSFVSLVARLYTRIFLLRQPGLDDVLVVAGMIVAVGLNAVALGCEFWNHSNMHSHLTTVNRWFFPDKVISLRRQGLLEHRHQCVG